MTFKEYLNKKKLTLKKAAEALGFPYEYVRRYVNEGTIPSKKNMGKIIIFTKGKVTADDFYGVNK